MNKALAIMELFPNTEPMKDFIVQDDGDERGQYIAMWNIDAPQPTEEELQAAWELIKDAPPPKSPDQLRIEELEAQLSVMNTNNIEFMEMILQTLGVE